MHLDYYSRQHNANLVLVRTSRKGNRVFAVMYTTLYEHAFGGEAYFTELEAVVDTNGTVLSERVIFEDQWGY